MTKQNLDAWAELVALSMKRALDPRDERIKLLEQRVSDLEGRLALDQRLKTIDARLGARLDQHPGFQPDPLDDVSDLVQ